MSHSDQLNLKMANNSAEKKGACSQRGLGLGMEVHVYFWTSKLQRPRSMIGAVLSPADSWAGYPLSAPSDYSGPLPLL